MGWNRLGDLSVCDLFFGSTSVGLRAHWAVVHDLLLLRAAAASAETACGLAGFWGVLRSDSTGESVGSADVSGVLVACCVADATGWREMVSSLRRCYSRSRRRADAVDDSQLSHDALCGAGAG